MSDLDDFSGTRPFECIRCGKRMRTRGIDGRCIACFEASLQAREAAIRAQLAEAKRRARTWQLGRVAS